MARTRTDLNRATLQDLEAAIDRRRRDAEKLRNERERLAARLADVDRQLANITGETPASTPAPPRKKKVKKKKAKAKKAPAARRQRGGQRPLSDMLAAVMSPDEPRQVADLAKAVKRRGYKTKSSDFGAAVSAVLGSDPRFKRVARGQYVLVK